MSKVLITGGTGTVGTRLTALLLEKGYEVAHLSRSIRDDNKNSIPNVKNYVWNIKKGYIQPEAFENLDYIVHLAGAGVADERWTDARKKDILESRTLSTQLLYNQLKEKKTPLKAFISASAIGIYGFDTGNTLLTEESPIATEFLADVVKKWEEEVQKIASITVPNSPNGIRVAKLRIGIVLSNKGGALVEMAKPVRLFAGAALGTGKQFLSWIHVDDLCKMFIFAIENEQISGEYNAAGASATTNQILTKSIAKVLEKPLFLPNVPAFMLKIILGEMAGIVLGGNNVSSEKIQKAGFKFDYTDLDIAVKNLLQ